MSSKLISLRFAGICSVCKASLPTMVRAYWNSDSGLITCLTCKSDIVEIIPGQDTPIDVLSRETSHELTRPTSGVAGLSANLEFQRRHDKRDVILDQRFKWFSPLVKLLLDDPQSTKAWQKGGSGEEELAEFLSRRVGDSAIILNDRKIPRSSANIDHLVIAASGVWIIDAKKYSGNISRVDKGGWRKIDYHLYVGKRDRTGLVEGIKEQEIVVRNVLGSESIPIHVALCFLGVGWSLFLKPFEIGGAWVTYPKKLAELISQDGPLSHDERLRVSNLLDKKLPPKIPQV